MSPQCPWDGWSPATIHYCEDNLCSWITQPANAWSNMGFVLVGIALVLRARRQNAAHLKLIGPIAIAVGITSFAYHASFSFAGQVFDLGSMYCLSALLIVMNAQRLGSLKAAQVPKVFAALVIGTTTLVVIFRVIGIPLFALQLATALELERRARAASSKKVDYRGFLFALGAFAAAFAFWILDFSRLWCDPRSHWIQGHAIWHVLDAFVFAGIYRFYEQFELKGPTSSRGDGGGHLDRASPGAQEKNQAA
jgi:hypothetical protein